jgi:hypothetical protein
MIFKTQFENQSLFYLRNCGFILGKVPLLSEFKRTENKIEPNINFNELPLILKIFLYNNNF